MAVTEAWTLSAVTVGATEVSVTAGGTTLQTQTTAGAYQLFVDPVTNMAKADEFRVRLYEKVLSGGTQRVCGEWSLLGTQNENMVTPTFLLRNGFDWGILKLAGTDRAFSASVRKAAGATFSEAWTLSAVTVGATEVSVTAGGTTLQAQTSAGAYQLFVDPVTNMAKADNYRLRCYEKVLSGGVQRILWESELLGAQSDNFVSPVLNLMNGFDWGIKKIAGTDRAFSASVRKIA